MAITIKLNYLGNEISLCEALNKGYVKILDNKIEENSNIVMSLSSKLFDWNNREIFENDIVKDNQGNIYKIAYDYGMFYFSDPVSQKIIMPISVCKLGDKIDVEVIN